MKELQNQYLGESSYRQISGFSLLNMKVLLFEWLGKIACEQWFGVL